MSIGGDGMQKGLEDYMKDTNRSIESTAADGVFDIWSLSSTSFLYWQKKMSTRPCTSTKHICSQRPFLSKCEWIEGRVASPGMRRLRSAVGGYFHTHVKVAFLKVYESVGLRTSSEVPEGSSTWKQPPTKTKTNVLHSKNVRLKFPAPQ